MAIGYFVIFFLIQLDCIVCSNKKHFYTGKSIITSKLLNSFIINNKVIPKDKISATTNEIATQAAVPIGYLYSYFKNKDMILLEILDDYKQAFIDRIDNLNIGENIDLSPNGRSYRIY